MKEWFYGKSGQQYGPIDESTLRARIATGEVDRNDLIWSDGMAQWTPLREMPEFYEAQLPPPISPDQAGNSDPHVATFAESPYAAPPSSLNPAPGMSAIPPTNGLATASLIMGIFSLFCGGPLLGVPAVICGHMALGQIKRSDGRQDGSGKAIAGLITGYIGIAVTALFVLLALIGTQVQ